MEDVRNGKTGCMLWAVACVVLLLVWVASMSMDDDRLCSSVPLCFGFAAVLILAIMGMVAGARPARPTPVCLFGLAAGLYFLIRCVSGDMLSEVARELPLILAAFVFYGAGYLMAQRRGGSMLSVALCLGVVVNIVYFFLMQNPEIPVEAMGRPAMSLAGANSQGCTLFVYKNFSAMFLMVAGGALICQPIWGGWTGWGSMLAALVGMAGVVIACMCDSRSVMALPCLMMVVAWVLWVVIRLYSKEKIGWGIILTGIALLVGIVVVLGELFMGSSLLQQILEVDTHGRADLKADIYKILPQVPWYGYGPGATTWQLVPFVNSTGVPNYAHDDYLQAWVDYGVVGVGLLVAVLLLHLVAGFWSLASEDVDRQRRMLVASCILMLISLAACAAFDFIWHNMALVGFSAMACGVLAAPVPCRPQPLFKQRKWAAGYRPSLRPVRFMGKPGAAFCCIGCVALAVACSCFAWRLLPAWRAQWEYNAMWHAGAPDGERVEFLERVMPLYPDPELVDHYVTLRPPAGRENHAACKEKMLNMALQTNPRQLFSVVMLAEVLGRNGRCEEAEALMRAYYAPDGQPGTRLANWPAYYGLNLLYWGKAKMVQGDFATALSMMEYALNIWPHADEFRQRARTPEQARERFKTTRVYVAARRVDVDMLRAIGVEKNDSWMEPTYPGGPRALYSRWGREQHSVNPILPYIPNTPLKL